MYELAFERGRVTRILKQEPGITFFEIDLPEEGLYRGINYDNLTGEVEIGDEVIINTTAIELELGSGGYHFLIFNLKYLDRGKTISREDGHIMKLRYTPFQIRTASLEEEDSLFHDELKGCSDLEGMPVIIIPLHSLLAPLVITFKELAPAARVLYIMTEGGCLPLELSDTVRELKANGFIDQTITVGHSFGGDLEAVNIFTGLLAAKKMANKGLIVAGMGPGIVGTATKFGHSGVENYFIYHAIRTLKGKSLLVPRISLADKRSRHYGISHHFLTLVNDMITEPLELVFPRHKLILKQLKDYKIEEKHLVSTCNPEEVMQILRKSEYFFYSMGRSLKDDPLFFATAGLAAYRLIELLKYN